MPPTKKHDKTVVKCATAAGLTALGIVPAERALLALRAFDPKKADRLLEAACLQFKSARRVLKRLEAG